MAVVLWAVRLQCQPERDEAVRDHTDLALIFNFMKTSTLTVRWSESPNLRLQLPQVVCPRQRKFFMTGGLKMAKDYQRTVKADMLAISEAAVKSLPRQPARADPELYPHG